jgi:hypothetical protein
MYTTTANNDTIPTTQNPGQFDFILILILGVHFFGFVHDEFFNGE